MRTYGAIPRLQGPLPNPDLHNLQAGNFSKDSKNDREKRVSSYAHTHLIMETLTRASHRHRYKCHNLAPLQIYQGIGYSRYTLDLP